MPSRQAAEVLLHERRKRAEAAPLLDERVPDLRDEAPLHNQHAAPHHTMGARACARSRTAPPRRESAGHASAARNGRAPLRHDQGADGRDALPDEDAATRRHRDGAQRARLQFDACDQHRWRHAAHGGDQGVGAGAFVRRSATNGHPEPAEDASGLRQAGYEQKLLQMVTSMRFRPVASCRRPHQCVITQPRPKAEGRVRPIAQPQLRASSAAASLAQLPASSCAPPASPGLS